MKERVKTLDLYTRCTNLEISGIPKTPRENVEEILKDVGKVLGMELTAGQVTAAHRIPSFKKERAPSLIVQFQTKLLKETLMTGRKKSQDVGGIMLEGREMVTEAREWGRRYVRRLHRSLDNQTDRNSVKESERCCSNIRFVQDCIGVGQPDGTNRSTSHPHLFVDSDLKANLGVVSESPSLS
ncbi:hypothetical protein J6590_068815 [Homalodisca vitripennis]|nr:hypothetical protein J6590_068815 [Homalodisca vitripennis]